MLRRGEAAGTLRPVEQELAGHNPSVAIDGQRLRLLRRRHGLTQQALADQAAPVSRSYIARIESGAIRQVSQGLAERLAAALAVALTDLAPAPAATTTAPAVPAAGDLGPLLQEYLREAIHALEHATVVLREAQALLAELLKR